MLPELQATALADDRLLPGSEHIQRRLLPGESAAEAAAGVAARVEQDRRLRRGEPTALELEIDAGVSDPRRPLTILSDAMLRMERMFTAQTLQIGRMGQYERELIAQGAALSADKKLWDEHLIAVEWEKIKMENARVQERKEKLNSAVTAFNENMKEHKLMLDKRELSL